MLVRSAVVLAAALPSSPSCWRNQALSITPPLMQHQRLLRRTQTTAPTPPPSAPADLGQVPLNAETIQHLHSTLRSLPRPLLESLTRAFRKRFQVPEAAATIADRINPKCHDWIETLLKKRQELTREQAIKLWAQKRQQGCQPCEPQWLPPPAPAER
jgi:hypothetical protein